MSEYQRKKFALQALRAWLYSAGDHDRDRHRVLDKVIDLDMDLYFMRMAGKTGK